MNDATRRNDGLPGAVEQPRVATMLATIREAEREMVRRIEEAKAAAEARVTEAQAAADAAVVEARKRGVEQAEAHHRERLATVGEEADRIRREGRHEADRLLETLRPRLTERLDDMVALVVQIPTEEGRCSST
ncbi:MAG: hypothetical protein OES24_00265 [Acidimicrobiia bacterium]|nr:hypothetical protein [Acidimicrobiia bacterium]